MEEFLPGQREMSGVRQILAHFRLVSAHRNSLQRLWSIATVPGAIRIFHIPPYPNLDKEITNYDHTRPL